MKDDGDTPGGTDPTVTVSVVEAWHAGGERRPGGPSGLPVRDRGRYEFLDEHARGGLGKVWRARDRELGRVVALKEVLPPDDVARARFVREALVTARLEHPAIVPVHEAGRWDSGEPFYVMKLVSGRTLAEVVKDKTRLADRLSLLPGVIAVADAIAYAHSQGVMHRDLKPANVIVGAYGETVVIDWGLAKELRGGEAGTSSGIGASPEPAATLAGGVVGTPSFMAPEQARGEGVDERADVYALGALLYFVLTGRPPHSGQTTAEVLHHVRSERPQAIATLEPGVSADLVTIVDKAMAPDAELRYPSAGELVQDLKRFQTGQMVSAHEYSLAQLAGRWVRRNRGVALATSLFVLLAGAGVVAFLVSEQRLRRSAEVERDRADQKTLALLEEQGRAELARGRPIRAAAYLIEAYRRKPSSIALRSLVTQAVAPLGRLERRLVGHTRDVPFAAYSPDGTRIVTASADGTARVWAADDGRTIAVLKGDDRWVDAATFSPDGRRVAVAANRAVRIFRADTGELLRSTDDRGAYRVWFMPDGKRLVVGFQSGELRLRDADTGALLDTVKHHTDRIHDLAFSPDGKRFAVASWDGVASVWDVATFRPVLSLRDPDAIRAGVAYSADGAWLLTVDMDVYVRVRRADTGDTVYSLRLPDGARDSRAAFSLDARTIITCSHDGGVRTWHAASGTLLESFDPEGMGKLMYSAIRPDGRQLVTTGVAGAVQVWRLDEHRGWRLPEAPPGDRKDIGMSAYVRDGSAIVAGRESGEVVEWDPATGARRRGFAVDDAFSVTPNADGTRVVVGHADSPAPPELWDTQAGRRIAVLEGATARTQSIAASADGTTIATASYDGGVRLYDFTTGKALAQWNIDPTRMTAVAFRPDGRELAATVENGTLLLLDRATGKVVRSIAAHPTWIQDVAYSNDGARIVTAGRQDHVAKVWDAATGRPLLTLAGHQNNLIRASFSPDGAWIATVAMDNTAIIWDARTGEILRTIAGPCYTAAFSPGGRELFAGGHLGYGVIWDLRLDERSPEELARFVAERSPWELVDGRARLRPGF